MSLIKVFLNSIALLAILNNSASAQTDSTIDHRKQGLDALALGIGTGLDYGGFGLRMLAQTSPNIGFFLGVGIWDGFLAANVGLKARVLSKPQSTVSPYLMAMYGRNEMTKIPTQGIRNRISLGAGLDLFNTPKSFGYITLGANYALLPQTIYFTIGLNVIVAKAK